MKIPIIILYCFKKILPFCRSKNSRSWIWTAIFSRSIHHLKLFYRIYKILLNFFLLHPLKVTWSIFFFYKKKFLNILSFFRIQSYKNFSSLVMRVHTYPFSVYLFYFKVSNFQLSLFQHMAHSTFVLYFVTIENKNFSLYF